MAKKDDKLNYKQLSAELKAKGPERLYILHGEEDYLLESFVRELTAACLPEGADDFSFRELSGEQLTMQLLADSVNSLPFATERTLTLVRGWDVNRLRETDVKALERIVSDIPDFATLAVICRGAQEPDGRLKAVKLLRRFFSEIPRPFALILSASTVLPIIYRTLEELGLRVPEEVSVLCNTDDWNVTENAMVPTSYVSGEFPVLGRKLPELLDRMMAGEKIPEEPIYVTPSSIISRRSSIPRSVS